MSLIEQGDSPWKNQISVQPEPSAVIHPNSEFQQETPTLTEETDKRTSSEEESGSDSRSELDSDPDFGSDYPSESSSETDILLRCLRKIICLRVERIVAPKLNYLKEPDSYLSSKEKQIAKANNIFNTLLSNAKFEKKSRLKMIRNKLLQKSSLTNEVDCITFRGRLVSAFFVMLRDGKQGGGGQWYLVKGCNVTIKIIKAFFILL